jgi:hypothetical protein
MNVLDSTLLLLGLLGTIFLGLVLGMIATFSLLELFRRRRARRVNTH